MSRKSYRWNQEKHAAHGGNMTDCNPDDPCSEEIGAPMEWVINGERYGRDTLDMMKAKGLVPTSDFTEHWAKHKAEQERVYKLGRGDLSQMKRNERLREQISNAVDAVRAGKGVLGRRNG